MWVLEADRVVLAGEQLLEAARLVGEVGTVSRVFLRCVKMEEEEEEQQQQQVALDSKVWSRLPPDLASRIIFHLPLPNLLQQGWPLDHLINFPPVQKHALFVDNRVAFHNFSSSTRRVELPPRFVSAQPLALSPQGMLVATCFSNSTSSRHYLACCHLPTSTTFSLIKFPVKKRKPLSPSIRLYVHVFHPNKLEPATSYALILVLGRGLFLFTSGKWKCFTDSNPFTMYYSVGVSLQDKHTLPEMELPPEFVDKGAVPVQGPDKRFKFMYSVCARRNQSEGPAVLSCMRLDTVQGEWEVMPGPPKSLLREVNLHQLTALDSLFDRGIAVFEYEKRRLVLGFVEPWEWVLSTNIITLSNHTPSSSSSSSGCCKLGRSVELLLP